MRSLTVSWVREHLWVPARAGRERTAATALLLLLVMGTAHAASHGPWPRACLPATECQAVDARTSRAARCERPVALEAVRTAGAAAAPRRRARSIADAELPPIRAPDRP